MPIQFKCPECGGALSVPSRYVGQAIACPLNGCAIVLKEEPAAGDKGGAVRFKVEKAGPTTVSAAAPVAAAAPAHSNGSAAKSAAPFTSNSARFITAESSPSTVQLAADGRLPELHLQEGPDRRAAAETIKGSSPKTLAVLLGVSLGLSVLMLLADFSPSSSEEKKQAAARERIADFYRRPQPDGGNGTLAPYQQLLRDAQQARSRGDRAAERRCYLAVVKLLRAEGRPRYESLTRTPKEDEELAELLAILLVDEQ